MMSNSPEIVASIRELKEAVYDLIRAINKKEYDEIMDERNEMAKASTRAAMRLREERETRREEEESEAKPGRRTPLLELIYGEKDER